MAKTDYFCGECGYMDNKPGICPNCSIPLESIGDEETGKNPQKSETYPTDEMEASQKTHKDPLKKQIEEDDEEWDSSTLSQDLSSEDLTE